MRKLVLLSIFVFLSFFATAQSGKFRDVAKACLLAQESMSYGEGSRQEIEEALELLMKTEWETLVLQEVDTKNEASFKGHMVFTPEFFKEVAKDSSVYKLAKKYAKEQTPVKRGGNVKLCTKCVKGGESVEYAVRYAGSNLNIAAIAEVNGLINMEIAFKDAGGKILRVYKSHSQEFSGADYREFLNVDVPKGVVMVHIIIENKSYKDKSIAIVVE